MSAYRSLLCLSLLHCVVDTYAMLLEPLWPRLSRDLRLSSTAEWLLLTASLLAINFSQPLFGYIRDHWQPRWILWVGPLVGVICLPLAGILPETWMVGLAILVGMGGMGAFHPEAVTMAGRLQPEQRTRAISIFLVGGTLGLGLGPLTGGYVVQMWGWPALACLALPGILLVFVFERMSRKGDTPRATMRTRTQVPLREFWATDGRAAALLLAVATLRVFPAVGIPKAVAYTLAQQNLDLGTIGVMQSLFLSAGSIGMLWLAGRFHPGTERRHLLIDPWVALPLIAALPMARYSLLATGCLLALAGLVLNGTTAAVISYGQQLLPRNTGLASSLTMGFAWGLSGLLVAALTTWTSRAGHAEWMYWMFLPALVGSSLLACLLPRTSPLPAESRREDMHTADPLVVAEESLVRPDTVVSPEVV